MIKPSIWIYGTVFILLFIFAFGFLLMEILRKELYMTDDIINEYNLVSKIFKIGCLITTPVTFVLVVYLLYYRYYVESVVTTF